MIDIFSPQKQIAKINEFLKEPLFHCIVVLLDEFNKLHIKETSKAEDWEEGKIMVRTCLNSPRPEAVATTYMDQLKKSIGVEDVANSGSIISFKVEVEGAVSYDKEENRYSAILFCALAILWYINYNDPGHYGKLIDVIRKDRHYDSFLGSKLIEKINDAFKKGEIDGSYDYANVGYISDEGPQSNPTVEEQNPQNETPPPSPVDEALFDVNKKELKIIVDKSKIKELYDCFVKGIDFVSRDQDLAYLFRVALDHKTLNCQQHQRKKFTDLLVLWKIYDTNNNATQLAHNMKALMDMLPQGYKSWYPDNEHKNTCEHIGDCFKKFFPYPSHNNGR